MVQSFLVSYIVDFILYSLFQSRHGFSLKKIMNARNALPYNIVLQFYTPLSWNVLPQSKYPHERKAHWFSENFNEGRLCSSCDPTAIH